MGRIHAPNQPLRYSIIMGTISLILLGVAVVVYTGWALEENNRRLCGVIAASLGLDGDPATPLPPTTARGQRIVNEMVELYRDYDCEEVGLPPIVSSPGFPHPTPSLPAEPTATPTVEPPGGG